MTMITRWEPFHESRRLHDMIDRFMDRSFLDRPWFGEPASGMLPLDVYQTEDEFVVKASIPGIKPDEIDISVRGDTLTIQGQTRSETEREDEGQVQYLLRERRYSSFSRSVTLPASVDSSKASAEFENGILTLTLPKVEEEKPKRITIKAK